MYGKVIFNIILILSLAIIQLSFITGLPGFFCGLNLAIMALIFILGLVGFKFALWWAVGLGLFFDIYSFAPFGVYLICLPAVVLLANFLLANFFTNRSLYSFLALTLFAYAVYEFLLHGISYAIYFLDGKDFGLYFNADFWLNKLGELVINLLAVLIIFYLLSFVSGKLKPVFLVRR